MAVIHWRYRVVTIISSNDAQIRALTGRTGTEAPDGGGLLSADNSPRLHGRMQRGIKASLHMLAA